MSDIWTFDQQPEPEAPVEREPVGIPGDPATGRPTRIFPAPVSETATDEDPEPIAPGEEYAVNLNRLLRRPRNLPPQPPHPPAPPPPPGHNMGPPMGPTPAGAEENILRTIQPEPVVKEPFSVYDKLIDNLDPIKRAMGEMPWHVSPTDTIDNPYEQFRLARGAPGKAEHMLRHGTINFGDLSNVGESFEDIVKPIVQAGERDPFVSYLKARHAMEMEQHGMASGVDLNDAFTVVGNGAGRYEPYAQAMDKYQEDVLKYAKDAGLLSEQAFDNMRQKWSTYIPMYRAFEKQPGNPREFNVSNPVRRRTGSEEATLDPLESIIRNTYSMTEMAERNRAAQTFVDYFQARPGQIPLHKVKQPVLPTNVTAAETRRALENAGIDTRGIPDRDMPGFAVFRHGKQQQLRPGEIAVFRDGKREIWRTDPAVAEAITNMDGPELGLFTKMMGAPIARTLRAGVTMDPAYMARNIWRDQITAVLQSDHNYRPFIDAALGLKSRLTKDEHYQRWLKSGGSQATMVAMDRKHENPLLRKYGAKPQNFTEKVKRYNPLEPLRTLSETVENATRIGEFRRATQGSEDVADIMRGGMAARDVTQDFGRHGSATKAYIHATPFAGGQIQGLDRELTNFAKGDNTRRAATMANVATYLTIPTLLLWYYNKDDPRYQNESNQVKDRYWLLYPKDDPNAEPWRITKGFTTGIGATAPLERVLDKIHNDNPEAFKGLIQSIAESAVPGFMPATVAPIAEHVTNTTVMSKFQRPLVGRRYENIQHPERSHPGTSETAKLAGKGLGAVVGDRSIASPMVIDNYIRGYFGTLGKYATMGADEALKRTGLADTTGGEKAEKKWSDVPALGSFVQRYPSGGMQPIQDFYEKYDEAKRAHQTKRMLEKRGGDASHIKELERMETKKRQMDRLQRRIMEINYDSSLTAKQKRQELDETYMEMLETAKGALGRE